MHDNEFAFGVKGPLIGAWTTSVSRTVCIASETKKSGAASERPYLARPHSPSVPLICIKRFRGAS